MLAPKIFLANLGDFLKKLARKGVGMRLPTPPPPPPPLDPRLTVATITVYYYLCLHNSPKCVLQLFLTMVVNCSVRALMGTPFALIRAISTFPLDNMKTSFLHKHDKRWQSWLHRPKPERPRLYYVLIGCRPNDLVSECILLYVALSRQYHNRRKPEVCTI